MDIDEIGSVEDQILCEDNHSFVRINNSDVNPGINTDDDVSNYNENEDEDDEVDVNNNDNTLDDEDGGTIINYGPNEYDEFNIPITVGHFRMDGRHAVFGFYMHITRQLKQVRKKLGIILFYVQRHWISKIMINEHG